MSELAIASALANVVGLLSQFVATRNDTQSKSDQEFMEWLRRQNHHETIKAIEQNARSLIGIKILLSERLSELERKLDLLAQVPGESLGKLPELAAVLDKIKMNPKLSKTAFEMIKILNKCEAGQFVVHHTVTGVWLICLNNVQEIFVQDSRFLQDNISFLVEEGLLREGPTHQQENTYFVTRLGAEFAEAMQA